MNLKLIQQYAADFKAFLQTEAALKSLFAWESQRYFYENWQQDAEDFHSMYDNALQNSETRRLWVRQAYFPKKRMLEFIDMQPEFVRSMFQELYNEEKELQGRVDRFLFYCDELFREYQEKHPKTIETEHFHRDEYQMISLYLAFRYPDQYALYDFDAFQKTLKLLLVAKIPLTHDLERYFKVLRTLFKLLTKDEELVKAHQKRLDPGKHYMQPSLLLAWEYIRFCSKINR